MLAQMGETWHCRPSEFIAGLPDVTAFQIDAAAVVKLGEAHKKFEPQPEEGVTKHIYL